MGRRPDPKIRQRIIDQAEHLMHLKGFHSTSMEEIASACAMTKANLFHHYGSKEELGLAVLDAKMSDYNQRRIEPICCQDDPGTAVYGMFEEAAKFYQGNGCKAGCFIGNIALEMSDINEAFRRRISLFFEEWARSMSCCLDRARKAGRLAEALDSRATAEAVIALYEGAIMMARTRRDASVFKRVGRIARRLLEQHEIRTDRRRMNMGPKTPCGC